MYLYDCKYLHMICAKTSLLKYYCISTMHAHKLAIYVRDCIENTQALYLKHGNGIQIQCQVQ